MKFIKYRISSAVNWIIYRCNFSRKRKAIDPYKRLAIYKIDRLGDLVLSLGAVRMLVNSYGSSNCVFIGSKFSKALMAQEFKEVEFLEFSIGHVNLLRTKMELFDLRTHPLFRKGVSELVCLRNHRSLCDEMILESIPAGQYFGIPRQPFNEGGGLGCIHDVFSKDKFAIKCAKNECREQAMHRSLLQQVLRVPLSFQTLLPELRTVIVSEGNFIGISPFGSSTIRDIPFQLLLEVTHLAKRMGWGIRIWSDGSDNSRYETLAARIRNGGGVRVEVFITSSLQSFLNSIASASLVISTETATAHLATALNKRLLVILGGGHYGWFAPWHYSNRQRWITNHLECFGCNWNCPYSEPYCITKVNGLEILRALNSVLNEA